ncbi:MAG: hypothetical protein ACUVX1_03745 [Chloroflexota bacterium]
MLDTSFSISPGWILSFFFAGACAAAFKLLLGHRARGLLQCWAISLVGFLAGQAVSEHFVSQIPVALPQIGDVYWPPGVLTAWLLLFVVARVRLW